MARAPLKSGNAASDGALPDPLGRVAALAPHLAAAAEEIDRERRLPAGLLAALHEAEMFRLLLPRPMGGAELDPPSFVRVIEEIAKLDASTAWCLCQNDVCSMVAAFLAPEAAREIFVRDAKAVLAWGPGPNARATAVEGGYRVSGSFAFASGGRHATWLGAHCALYEGDGRPRLAASGAPVTRTMLFPADAAPLSDIWHVIGLRGTASDAYGVNELFVPEAHTLARDDQAERRYPGKLYALPTNSLFSCGFACVALGLARSLVDSFCALALEKTARGYKSRLRESAVVQSELAQAEARLRGARMYLLGTLDEVWANVERRNAVTLAERMAIRLAATHAIREATQVADAAYHAAGATAIFESNPFERRFRDIHTVAQQLQGRHSHFETVGKHLLGFEADLAFL